MGGQNVLDHGADPTGATDSTDAFLRAMAVLGRRGGIVHIPAGRYRIDGAPISVHAPIRFLGEGGIPRTARNWSNANPDPAGSLTTLEFPHDRDGFVVEIDAERVGFANLALVRNKDSDPENPEPQAYARRGIHAKRPIFADSLYLVSWEPGIDLDGRPKDPEKTDPHIIDPDDFNVIGSQVERIFAEDCFWGTYTQGLNAGGCHFLHVVCHACEAGIFESSLGGNGYVNCYVEGNDQTASQEPPYYIDNQSVLFSCRSESWLPAQFGETVQVIGGTFNISAKLVPVSEVLKERLGIPMPPINPFRQINGVPALLVSNPFEEPSGFAGGEQITVTVDGETHLVTFDAGDQSPAQIASRIQAEFPPFPDLPRVAYASNFDDIFRIEGWRGHGSGSVRVDGEPAVLAQLRLIKKKEEEEGKKFVEASAGGIGQLLTQPEIFHAVFLGYSGPGGSFGTSEALQVQAAPNGSTALLWQTLGEDGENEWLAVMRFRDVDADTRRWGFKREEAGNPSLSVTMQGDSLGPDQVVMHGGVWLQSRSGGPAVLLCNGRPNEGLDKEKEIGRESDIAWDMAANPPDRYVKVAGEWVPAPPPPLPPGPPDRVE